MLSKKILLLATLLHIMPFTGVNQVKAVDGDFFSNIIPIGMLGVVVSINVINMINITRSILSSSNSSFTNNYGSRAVVFDPYEISERFSSVASAGEAKEELQNLVDYLKNPQKYKEIGAKIRKGVLLTGSPGNGKTLLARALAGEAGAPFVVISGADFAGKYIGDTTRQVRLLFDIAHSLANKHGKCIVFIDEIDAIAQRRGSSSSHNEYDLALNKFLTEMDGFVHDDAPIIVLGATNRVNILDEALLRPGRFDRIIKVKDPDLEGRKAILNIHASKIKVGENVDLHEIARATEGFSGAQIAGITNEAALLAIKMNSSTVQKIHFEEAVRIVQKTNDLLMYS